MLQVFQAKARTHEETREEEERGDGKGDDHSAGDDSVVSGNDSNSPVLNSCFTVAAILDPCGIGVFSPSSTKSGRLFGVMSLS